MVTHAARERSSDHRKFVAWVDGNLSRIRALHKGEPFPFDDVVSDLKRNIEHWTQEELPQRVEEWCCIVEKEKLIHTKVTTCPTQ